MSLNAANNYKTKKALKSAVGQPLMASETSLYGNEWKDNGQVTVVGPCAYTNRKWFATVKLEGGIIKEVK